MVDRNSTISIVGRQIEPSKRNGEHLGFNVAKAARFAVVLVYLARLGTAAPAATVMAGVTANGVKPLLLTKLQDLDLGSVTLGTGVWSAAASFPEGRAQHAAVLLGDGRVLVIGGERDFLSMNWLSSTLIYGPPTP